MTLGERLAARRAAKGLSLTALAKILDCSAAAICQWEGDRHLPNRDRWPAICEALDMELKEFLPVGAGAQEGEA